ncbi:hypothetical protein KRP22_010574 [Phytophthora ramorum]|nr:Kinesin-like protein KIF13A [Phytophthora ramorum]
MFLPTTSSQEDVFEKVRAKELVEAALDGFPVTIFAYGQTGAGKSFTIFGREDGVTERKMALHEQDGLLPRTAQELMNSISARKGEVEYTLRVTCVEIYNEQVRDVFDPRKETLAVRSSKTHGFFLENATVVECVTAREIVRVVKAAATHRAKSSHLLNESSNRSHCLVTIYIDAAPLKPDSSAGGKRYGKITIVDLAGSERVSDSGAVGTQLRETCHINRSLHCLSQVIQAMNAPKCSKTGKSKFVPYRDSKLTMLLLDSRGGNCKTLMIACVNASPQFAVESTRTLEFAMGVAKIKNRPTALLTPHEKLIKDLREQIRQLKLENMMLRARTPGYFLEHPDHKLDSSALLSDREDEYPDSQKQKQRHGKAESLNQPEDTFEARHRRNPSIRQKAVQQDLQTL